MTLAITAVLAGLGVGAVYGLVALGYTVTYNATGVFNLAQGQLVLVGIFGSYFLLDVAKWSQPATFAAVMVAVPAVGLLEERIAVRSFLRRAGEPIGAFISTLGFGLIITTVVVAAYGNAPVRPIPTFLPSGAIDVGAVHILPKDLFAIGGLAVSAAIVTVFYRSTWLGVAMRATASDRELAALRGVRPTSMSRLAFAGGGVMAAFAGFAVAPIVNADVTAGTTFTLAGFVALALGGFGSITGAIIGAFVLGIGEQLFGLYVNASDSIVADLLVLALVLCVRPTGLVSGITARRV